MPAHSRMRRSAKQIVNCDLELRPLMNVFIVLIPMLLMSAVFMEIRVIEMTLPRAAEAAAFPVLSEPFELAIRIEADAYVVEADGNALESIPRTSASAAPDAEAATMLSSVLDRIVASHPEHHEVRIISEPTTRYQEIVALMDVARAAGLTQAALDGGAGKGV